jgi:hypothetical protein
MPVSWTPYHVHEYLLSKACYGLSGPSCEMMTNILTWRRYTIPYHATPYLTIPYHTMPHQTTPCHTKTPCHTIPHHAMPYHTIPCHTIPCHNPQPPTPNPQPPTPNPQPPTPNTQPPTPNPQPPFIGGVPFRQQWHPTSLLSQGPNLAQRSYLTRCAANQDPRTWCTSCRTSSVSSQVLCAPIWIISSRRRMKKSWCGSVGVLPKSRRCTLAGSVQSPIRACSSGSSSGSSNSSNSSSL